uniref:Putative Erf family protein n=1 Tax=viral metagenome TaxID=1070528 RepID=A0A6H1ZRW7_9ZZZZ
MKQRGRPKKIEVGIDVTEKEQSTAIVKHNEADINLLLSQAIERSVPVETMEKLLAMRTQLKQEHAKENYNRALSEFQMECPVIGKNKVVKDKSGKDRYKYAPLDEIVIQTKELLHKYGFSYTFDARYEDNAQIITCTARHLDGHSESAVFRSPIDKDAYMSEVQKHGSAMTFAKRYAFCSVFGIMTGDEDTDGINGEPKSKAQITDAEIIPEPEKKPEETKKEVKVDAGVKKRLIEIANESSEEDRKILLQYQSKKTLNQKELDSIEIIKEKNAKNLEEKNELLADMKVKLLAKCIENEKWSRGIQSKLGLNQMFPKKEEFDTAISGLTVKDYDTVKTLLLLSVD